MYVARFSHKSYVFLVKRWWNNFVDEIGMIYLKQLSLNLSPITPGSTNGSQIHSFFYDSTLSLSHRRYGFYQWRQSHFVFQIIPKLDLYKTHSPSIWQLNKSHDTGNIVRFATRINSLEKKTCLFNQLKSDSVFQNDFSRTNRVFGKRVDSFVTFTQ